MSGYNLKAGLADIPSFTVVGISSLTDHSRAAEDINALWERFFAGQIGQKTQDIRFDDTIFTVYSDYQGSHEDPYRITIGYRIKGDAAVPDWVHAVQVQDQNYAVLSAGGNQPKALIETWQAVWSSDLPRSFKTDFEAYGPRFFEAGVHEILVHVGVGP